MSNDVLVTILTVVLSGGTVGVLVKAAMERKKTDAEAKNVNVTAEVSLSEGWQKYADELKEDLKKFKQENNELRVELKELRGLIDEMRKENNILKERLSKLDKK